MHAAQAACADRATEHSRGESPGYSRQANAKAEPCEGTRRRSVGAPTLCLCKTPGQEGLGRADAPRPTEKPGPRERDARSSPDASPCFGGRAKAAAC
jgi:hypothetical protein